MAMRSSAQTPTHRQPERAVKTAARGQMGHAVADKRVYCHEALHITRKLQSAGYKQSVEKWDSDSDSDASDDGDLEV